MVGRVEDRRQWLDQVRTAEDLGYSTVFISDHFSDKLAPLPALAMAAEHTSIGVGTLVLANDFRHPVVLAKEAATVDLLSEGRLELGIGTGWDRADYDASGIERDTGRVRFERFAEALDVLIGLWGPGVFQHDREHYSVHLDGLPKPERGRPRLLIGGGGRRMLGLAGRHADIVGLSAPALAESGDVAEKMPRAAEVMDSKLAWIREGAGDRFDDLELNVLLFGVEVGDRRAGAAALAEQWRSSPETILSSPHYLAGSPTEIIDELRSRREAWGVSYPVVPAENLADMAPVVSALTGT